MIKPGLIKKLNAILVQLVARGVGVFQGVDQFIQYCPKLLFVTTH